MIRIEPYKDEEVNDILKKLLANTEFLSFVEKNLNNKESKFLSLPGSKFLAMQLFKGKIKNIHTVDDFQNQMKKVLSSVIDKTIEKFTYSGVERLDKTKPYLFIGNHRDITLDSALCNNAITENGHETTFNAIGDNLADVSWMGDLLRLNKCFIIPRSGESKKEIYSNLMRSSSFIKETLESGNHVWIAQKQGRSKDGKDFTDSAVLKMLHMSLRKEISFEEITDKYNIVTCSISYEIDPLAKEKITSHSEEEKKYGEDVSHIFKGIMNNKGQVHLSIGEQIKGRFNVEELTKKIDSEIIKNYKLWETNEYAFKFLEDNLHDSNLKRAKNYYDELLATVTKDELNDIMTQYANPVLAKEGLNL